MNAQQLKNAILQEVIEGRLVPQDPNDEPASALLARIRQEKEQLVKAGKLKKKDLVVNPISEDEIPFEIPESWEWVRLSEVIDVRDGTHDTPAYIPHGYPLITGKDFYNGYFDLSKTQYISESDYIEICKRSKVDIGDILFSMIGGNIGSQILISRENYFEMAIKNVALFKQFPSKSVDSKYLSVFLESRVDHIKSIALGGAQSFVSLKMLRTYLFPLPPLAEQQRIVAKIEELLPKVEEYGKAQDALNKLNTELPERLKKSILQEAIEGRLVPQDPNDEPASVLLAKIRKEKEQLVKAGKLKKKDLIETPISEEEIPFEIPESWEWVRLGFISEIVTGKKDANNGDENGNYYFFTCSNTPLKSRTYSYDGDYLIMPGNGANIGQVIHFNGKFEAYQRTYLLKTYATFNLEYLKYHLICNWKEYNQDKLFGSAIPYIKLNNLLSYPVALPPLAEQHRIVEKLEQVLGEIDKLK
ncbi:restriction endonuclease subunit S [Prevotella sp. E2-28]|uniref:restriction endonuclease subunit S n=1 Tax=Prevotella sp. E2-28 TaxID=2913620 RepID=UPI001EDB642F|nr:restriction endonuclease subunit S [Prevotella sp. E2-28]UKK52440.1 restriction endonuclease subunit S [Prevotella sp. E2-28]